MDRLKKIAIDFDISDKLSSFREEFIIPKNKIYLDGNSLGLLSKKSISSLNSLIREEWGNDLVSSWNKSWVDLPKNISGKIASIINSKGEEVYVGSSTSNNLYKLIKSILDANKAIKSISTDSLNYPSDKYICEGISKDYNNFELRKAVGEKNVVKANRIIVYFTENPKNNPLVMTISLLNSFFTQLLLFHSLDDRSKNSVSKMLGVNPFFVDEYFLAGRNYPMRKVAQVIAFLRDADIKSKGVGANQTNEDVLKELLFKILH